MKILVVEDEARVADFLARGLRAERHGVIVAEDGETALAVCEDKTFDVIILDLLLPRISGREVCQILRQRGLRTPILMLSALGRLEERVEGLRLGADDYLPKPFEFDELLARIEALSRRAQRHEPDNVQLQLGDVEIDRETLMVRMAGQMVHLTAKELALLELLLSAPEKVFSRERILSNVWDLTQDPLTNVVDVYIGRLRRQLSAKGSSVTIETLRGFGYRLTKRQGSLE